MHGMEIEREDEEDEDDWDDSQESGDPFGENLSNGVTVD